MSTQSTKQSNEKTKSKNTYKNRQLISNNIDERRFQTNVVTYKTKQGELLNSIKELIEIHQECTRSSKNISLSKKITIEDVEHVVARAVDEAFGRRSSSNDEDGRPERDAAAAAALVATQEQLREARRRLTVATDRLRVSNKERRDLLNALHRDRSDPAAAESSLLRAELGREKAKNARLQSIVDEMYYATTTARDPSARVVGARPPAYTHRRW